MRAQRYLTVDEVAGRFGVNASTVYRLAQRGQLPAFKVGGQWRFHPEMLEAWVADRVTARRSGPTGHNGESAGPSEA